MHLRLATLALACLFPACGWALEGTVEGKVTVSPHGAREHPAAGVTVTALADPFWGLGNAKQLRQREAKFGPFPKIEVTGSSKTDADGNYSIKVSIAVKGDGELPKRRSSRRRTDVEVVRIRLEATGTGMQLGTQTTDVEDGGTVRVGITVQPMRKIKGRAVDAGGKPVPDLPIILYDRHAYWTQDYGLRESGVALEVRTDADGQFAFECRDTVSPGDLRVNHASLAFSAKCEVWKNQWAVPGVNLGDLPVVPGGSVKAAAINSDTGEPVYASWHVTQAGRYESFGNLRDASGAGLIQGIPAGKYQVRGLTIGPGWGVELSDIEVKAGQVTDVGVHKLEPWRELTLSIHDPEGKSVPEAQVLAVLEEGQVPAGVNYSDRRQKYTAWLKHGPDSPSFPDLFSGTWSVRVDARPYAFAFARVDLPTAKSLQITLAAGGSISARIELPGDESWSGESMAVMDWSSATDDVRAYDKPGPIPNELDQLSEGVFFGVRGEKPHTAEFQRLPAGTYLVAFFTSSGPLRQDAVVVRAGQATEITFVMEKARIEVAVTRGGKPEPRCRIFLVQDTSHDSRRFTEATTDEQGGIVFPELDRGGYRVATEPEAEFLRLNTGHHAGVTDQRLSPVYAMHGGKTERVAIDLLDPSRVWVTVTASAGGLAVPKYASLSPADRPGGMLNAVTVSLDKNEKYRFPPVPAGTYEFVTHFENRMGPSGQAYARLEVKPGPEFRADLKFSFSKLTVTAPVPESMAQLQRVVLLLRADDDRPPLHVLQDQNHASDPRYLRAHRLEKVDQVEMPMIMDGDYIVILRIHDGRSVMHAAHARVTVRGDSTLQLTPAAGTGSLLVEVLGEPAMIRPDAVAVGLVALSDGSGKALALADPDDRWFNARSGVLLSSVPPGTYTVSMAAQGLLSASQADVVVRAGERTMVRITPSQAGCALITLGGSLPPQAPSMAMNPHLRPHVHVVFENAKGSAIAPSIPGRPVSWFEYADAGARLYVHSMVKEVARVRIRVEGCAESIVPVEIEYGRVTLAEVELAAEKR